VLAVLGRYRCVSVKGWGCSDYISGCAGSARERKGVVVLEERSMAATVVVVTCFG
jgi:hypothetical protein